MDTLVVAPNWLGDLMFSKSLLQNLRALHPNSRLYLLVPEPLMGLAQAFEDVHLIPLPKFRGLSLRSRYRFAKTLPKVAQAYILPNSFKSALIPWMARIPVRMGYLGEWRFGVLNRSVRLNAELKRRYPSQAQRYAALSDLFESPLPFSPPQLILKPPSESFRLKQSQRNLSSFKRRVILAIGSAHGFAKCYDLKHFAALARAYLEEGFEVWLLGGEGDAPRADEILREFSPAEMQPENLCGFWSLEEIPQALSSAQLLIGNDSGLLHVASALGLAVIGLYGPTDPSLAPPLSPRAGALSLSPKLDCQPCRKRECPLKGEAYKACMRALSPESVRTQARALMNQENQHE